MTSNLDNLVIPAKAGIQVFCKGSKILDPGSRLSPGQASFSRDDEKRVFSTFYKTINLW